jgi:hypothetical protein
MNMKDREGQVLCGRPTVSGRSCRNAAAWFGSCGVHLTESERQEIAARTAEQQAIRATQVTAESDSRMLTALTHSIELSHSFEVTLRAAPGTPWPRYSVAADRWGYGGKNFEPRYASFRFYWKDGEPVPAEPGTISIREYLREKGTAADAELWQMFGRNDGDGSYREGFGSEPDAALAPEWLIALLPAAREAIGVQSAEEDARTTMLHQQRRRRELEAEAGDLESEAQRMEERAGWRNKRLAEIREELSGKDS